MNEIRAQLFTFEHKLLSSLKVEEWREVFYEAVQFVLDNVHNEKMDKINGAGWIFEYAGHKPEKFKDEVLNEILHLSGEIEVEPMEPLVKVDDIWIQLVEKLKQFDARFTYEEPVDKIRNYSEKLLETQDRNEWIKLFKEASNYLIDLFDKGELEKENVAGLIFSFIHQGRDDLDHELVDEIGGLAGKLESGMGATYQGQEYELKWKEFVNYIRSFH